MYTTRGQTRAPVSGVWQVLEVSYDYSYVKMSTSTSKTDEANKDDDDNILKPNELASCCCCLLLLLLLMRW